MKKVLFSGKTTFITVSLLFCFVMIGLLGCSGSLLSKSKLNRYIMEVDAYNNNTPLSSRKYILASGDSEISENNLQYIEFSNIVKNSLNQIGYSEASSLDEADLAIFIKFGISDPELFQQTKTVPIIGQTGVSSSRSTGTAYVSGNNVSYNQQTTYTPTYGVTGYKNDTYSAIMYLSYFIITAYDADALFENDQIKMIWNTIVTCNNRDNDLRRVFPYLVAAGQFYYGENSGEKKCVSFTEGDKEIKSLRGVSN